MRVSLIFLLCLFFSVSSAASDVHEVHIVNADDLSSSTQGFLYAIALILNGLALIISIFNRRKDSIRSHIDEFWMRKVVMPEMISAANRFFPSIKDFWARPRGAVCTLDIIRYVEGMQKQANQLILAMSRYSKISGDGGVNDMVERLIERIDILDGALVELCQALTAGSDKRRISDEAIEKCSREVLVWIDNVHEEFLGILSAGHRKIAGL